MMQISCTICSDLIVSTDAVFGTDCGHLFHHHCLLRWLERSKSCPQCRAVSSEKNIHRVYFSIHNGAEEDTNNLQNKIGCLQFEMMSQNTKLKKCYQEIDSLKKEASGLKNEVKFFKNEIESLEVKNFILKEKGTSLKHRNDILEPIFKNHESLLEEVKLFKNIDMVLKGSSKEVDDFLNSYEDSSNDKKTLVTISTVLKKKLETTAAKEKELSNLLHEDRTKIFSLNGQVRHLHGELKEQKDRNLLLESEISRANEERSHMQKQIEALQEALQEALVLPSDSHPSTVALRSRLAESPTPASLQRACLDDTAGGVACTTPDCPLPPSTHNEESPYLRIQSSAYGLSSLNQTSNRTRSKFSIFRKSHMSLYEQPAPPTGEEYDGMGGHSRPDVFPQAIRSTKVKKVRKNPCVRKIKIKDACKYLKMDHFLNK